MIYLVKIDGVSIPLQHVMSVSTSEISINFAGDKLISSKTTIDLSNHNYSYDDRQGTGGLFESITWYNSIVTVYNNETSELIWEGRLKKVELDDGKLITKLTVNDYIQDLVDTVCVINMLNVTVAEIIWQILTDADYLNIPETRLILSGFEIGISQQQNRKTNIAYTAQDNQKCIAVLEEICRLSNSHLFQRDNKIGYWVWSQYTGILGTPIYDADILPGSYNQNSDDSKICNEYSIGWNNTTVVAYATGSNAASKSAYGSGKLFAVPSDTVDSTAPASFKILYVTSAGAAEVGADILARFKDIKKTCTFQAGYHLDYVSLGDILDLRFSPFTREPVRVISMKPARDKRQIEFTCEFVNSPQVVALDLTAPDPVQMFEALYFEGSIFLKWSNSTANDLMNYKLYFSTSEGYWGNEFSRGRFSPVTIPVSSLSYIDEDCFYIFTPVDAEKTYYFRVSATDDSYNESGKSNTVSVTVPSAAAELYENRFNLSGNPYQGFTLDMSNPGSGTGLSEWAEYDTAEFDTAEFAPTALYESAIIRKRSGFGLLVFRSVGDTGDVMIQYRPYTEGVFGAWSTLTDAYSGSSLNLQGAEEVQWRVVFNSPNWSDADKFIVREVA
jgi:hypothetical protein